LKKPVEIYEARKEILVAGTTGFRNAIAAGTGARVRQRRGIAAIRRRANRRAASNRATTPEISGPNESTGDASVVEESFRIKIMNRFRNQFLAALTPGVRILLILLTAVALAMFIGRLTRAFDLDGWLGLTAQQFWHGQIWRLVTYALLPAGILNFIMNAFALIVLGGWLERVRSRGELWIICVVSTAGAGLAAVLLPFAQLNGAGPMMFGLLAAWCFHCGHEKVSVFPFGEITVRQLALAAAVSLLFTAFSAGWQMATVMAVGGLSGWLYVWLWHKWLMSRAASVATSERISRLEL
jgi:membrane associated rhomboid family serine protease